MEEKERYEIHIYDDICVDLYKNGVLDKSINDTYKLEELLNQQSKRIKELEQENQQLKQSQNQKAIEELNNLKRYCHEWYSWSDVAKRLDEVVDDRIKELKGWRE